MFSRFSSSTSEVYGHYSASHIGLNSLSPEQYVSSFVKFLLATLEFSHIISTTTVDFLDITVSINHSTQNTCIHYKHTNSHTQFIFLSSHSIQTKLSIPHSICRLCSDNQDFGTQSQFGFSWITSYHYQHRLCQSTFCVPCFCILSSQPPNHHPFSFPPHLPPSIIPLQSAILRAFRKLKFNSSTSHIRLNSSIPFQASLPPTQHPGSQ